VLSTTHTHGVTATLERLDVSLLVTLYQGGRAVVLSARGGELVTQEVELDEPMGVAAHADRVAIATRSAIHELRWTPERRLAPHSVVETGDIRWHDLAFGAGGELWMVATEWSCLATRDEEQAFTPRWRPPFISRAGPGDHCHLNGLAVADGRPRFVTALAESDEPNGWRTGGADGGILIDVDTGETVLRGLTMPHSPRWNDGRLWVLDSGRGALCVVATATASWEPVMELPGFVRGLAFAGGLAFIGLSGLRTTTTFGPLPVARHAEDQPHGVWIVDHHAGGAVGIVRIDGAGREVYDVAVLQHAACS
jgi:uncharacterized protein (TIGR03032 family)